MERLYALIENNKVANIIVANDWPDGIEVTDIDLRPGIGWDYVDGEFIAPTPIEVPDPESQPRVITRLALRNRFTVQELIAVEIACLDDPAADMTARSNAAALRVMQASLATANFIDLDNQMVRDGIQQLALFGLLGDGRAEAILDAPVQPIELT